MEQEIKEVNSLAELLEELEEKGITGQQKIKAVHSFLSDAALVKGRPFVASFELTPLCNFDCKMCYVHLNPKQMFERKLLSVDEWKHIIDMSVEAGVMFADITGGECLTYPGFKEVYLHLWNKGIHPNVLTNGSLLSVEMVEFFRRFPPKIIQITIYGSNEEAYQRVTGVEAFGDVMAGIQRLKNAGLKFKLSITPNQFMQEDSEALLETVRRVGVDYGIAGITLAARPETERKVEEYRIATDTFVELQSADTTYRMQYAVQAPAETKYYYSRKGYTYQPGLPCSAGRNTFHVNWKGEMTPCISFHSVVCPIAEYGVEGAWKQIKEKLAAYQEHKECAACQYKALCNSCPAEKCYGELGGNLNQSVCHRLKGYVAKGLRQKTEECSLRKEDLE